MHAWIEKLTLGSNRTNGRRIFRILTSGELALLLKSEEPRFCKKQKQMRGYELQKTRDGSATCATRDNILHSPWLSTAL
jgi:hypothetical protein